jgi:hypothetical protein
MTITKIKQICDETGLTLQAKYLPKKKCWTNKLFDETTNREVCSAIGVDPAAAARQLVNVFNEHHKKEF